MKNILTITLLVLFLYNSNTTLIQTTSDLTSLISPTPKTINIASYEDPSLFLPKPTTTLSTTTIMASNLTFPLPAENKTVTPVGFVGAPGQAYIT